MASTSIRKGAWEYLNKFSCKDAMPMQTDSYLLSWSAYHMFKVGIIFRCEIDGARILRMTGWEWRILIFHRTDQATSFGINTTSSFTVGYRRWPSRIFSRKIKDNAKTNLRRNFHFRIFQNKGDETVAVKDSCHDECGKWRIKEGYDANQVKYIAWHGFGGVYETKHDVLE